MLYWKFLIQVRLIYFFKTLLIIFNAHLIYFVLGVGIPKEEIPKLFQRFYRIESRQSRSHEGTGIGLALIHELITRHGGGIKCDSEVGKGTTFMIWIPTGHEHLPPGRLLFQKDMKEGKGGHYLGQENKLFDNKQLYLEEGLQWIQNNEPESNEDAESPIDKMNVDDYKDEEIDHKGFFTENLEKSYPIEDDPIPLSGTKHVVLLADDNTDMRNYLAGLLKKEFIVHCACDGREALKKLKKLKNPPDLILSGIKTYILLLNLFYYLFIYFFLLIHFYSFFF